MHPWPRIGAVYQQGGKGGPLWTVAGLHNRPREAGDRECAVFLRNRGGVAFFCPLDLFWQGFAPAG